MLFNAALFSSLLAPSVLAVPGASVAGHPFQLNRWHDIAISDWPDWAGAYFTEGRDTFDRVTATFTVPAASGSTEASTVAAIGIDGLTCETNSFLFVGVNFTVTSNGQTEYSAFYASGAKVEAILPGINSISAGDDIKLAVTTFSATSGAVTIENLSNNESASKNLTVNPLCRQDLGWIVKDLDGPLVDFGTITFRNAVAEGNGISYTPSNGSAGLADMVVDGQTVATTSTSGSPESFTIQYNGA